MVVYTYSEARQKLSALLDQAAREGEVRIRRKDGQIFIVKLQPRGDSPLDVTKVDLGVSTKEIVSLIREGRERA
jgi:hypothetical protein